MNIPDENGNPVEIPKELYPRILKMVRKYHSQAKKSPRREIEYHHVRQKDIDRFFDGHRMK